ncbi:hypothetical protein C0J52_04294 [Blattella germanica]|nr:hypothetical protein C0J52_04294 [Blattella germanica]
MDSYRFTLWFKEQLLPNIPENSVIIMDNASYHSRELCRAPTSNSRKSVMQEWLRKNNVQFDENLDYTH